jgi:hypothetical protein
MGDVEDPEIYAAEPLWKWQQSDYGQWCMEHCVEKPSFGISFNFDAYGYRCTIYGDLDERDYTFHQLKWSGRVNFN